MTTLSEALCVSRRPWLEASHIAQVARIGAVPLYVQHSTGTFASAVNKALSLARNPVVIKVDDHDSYPDDHCDILQHWKPGILVHGVAEFWGCDDTYLGSWPSLCASAFSSELRVKADRHGQITGSVLSQTKSVRVETGVRKLVCPGDWSWGNQPGTFRRIECSHDSQRPDLWR